MPPRVKKLIADNTVPPDYVPPKSEAVKPKRKYTGPEKGSEAAKERMAKVRAAQWAKNGLTLSDEQRNAQQ